MHAAEPLTVRTIAGECTEAGAAVLEVPGPRFEGTVRLRGGRSIGLAEYGSRTGMPILWFHGTPGGRRQIPPLARRLASEQGVRLVALQRPGMGDSTPHLYRSVLEWADDVGEIADQLGIDRFGLVGLSGGGPYVLACAHRMPRRVVAGAILGGVAPARGPDAPHGGAVGFAAQNRLLLRVLREPLARILWVTSAALRPLASQAFDVAIKVLPSGDQDVMGRSEMKRMFIEDILHATRYQMHAPVYDLILFTRRWGFSPRDVRVPIRLWHGDADNLVPLAHAQHLAEIIPDAELQVRPREGHLGNLDAVDEIFSAIARHWPIDASRDASATSR